MPLRLHSLSLTVAGSGIPPTPNLIGTANMVDRRMESSGVSIDSAWISLDPTQITSWPSDVIGWSLERSDNGGASFSVIESLIQDSWMYVDTSMSSTIPVYRARTITSFGTLSSYSNDLVIPVGLNGSLEDGSLNQVNVDTGLIEERVSKGSTFPIGLDFPSIGMGIAEASIGGTYGGGAYYVRGREGTPPITTANSPACGSTGVALPLTSITYTIRDLPYPTGGSGLDVSSIRIDLSATSVNGGAYRRIWDGSTSPWTPDVTVSIVAGAVPSLERDVTITLASSYLSQSDVVNIRTYAEDNDGNGENLFCEFTMASADVVPPVVDNQSPECGLGTTTTDLRRAPRDTSYSFRIYDVDSNINLATLQVYYGTSSSGPWTQVLQNGTTFLASFSGNVSSISGVPLSGYEVRIDRPSGTLWNADTTYYFRVTADDTQGNSVEDICSFKTEAESSIRQVIPLSQQYFLIEFSMGMKGGEEILDFSNYAVSNLETGNDVRVLNVLPQKFFVSTEEQNPTVLDGTGLFPRFVLIKTTKQDHWKEHRVTVSNLIDRYGNSMSVSGQTGDWTARKTKFDAEWESSTGLGVEDEDSLTSHILMAISFEQDRIGGKFHFDNWKPDEG